LTLSAGYAIPFLIWSSALQVTKTAKEEAKGIFPEVIWEGDEDHTRVHVGPVEDFARAIREKRQPKTGLKQALTIQKITDAIYASAEQKRAIEINE